MTLVNVSTYGQLLKELQKASDKALLGVGKQAEQLVKARIDSDVYGVGTPKDYKRTYGLRDSIFSESVGLGKLVIRHNWQNMDYNVENFQHASVYWSPWVYNRYLAETIHDGKAGGLFGQGFWRSPRPYMDNAKQEMTGGKYRQFMIEQLQGMGYTVI